jgi:hypothetical protein
MILVYPARELPGTTSYYRAFMDEAAAVVFITYLGRPVAEGEIEKGGRVWVAWYVECEAHAIFVGPSVLSRFDLTMSHVRGGYFPIFRLTSGGFHASRSRKGQENRECLYLGHVNKAEGCNI